MYFIFHMLLTTLFQLFSSQMYIKKRISSIRFSLLYQPFFHMFFNLHLLFTSFLIFTRHTHYYSQTPFLLPESCSGRDSFLALEGVRVSIRATQTIIHYHCLVVHPSGGCVVPSIILTTHALLLAPPYHYLLLSVLLFFSTPASLMEYSPSSPRCSCFIVFYFVFWLQFFRYSVCYDNRPSMLPFQYPASYSV